jgi:hypothetical protein
VARMSSKTARTSGLASASPTRWTVDMGRTFPLSPVRERAGVRGVGRCSR